MRSAARPARIEFDARAKASLARASLSAGVSTEIRIGEVQGFRFNPKQLEGLKMLRGPQRHTMFVGAARSSKTFLFVKQIVNRAMKAPNSRHAILRFRGNAVWATIGKDTLPKVMRLCFPGVAMSGPHKEGYYTLPNGSEIWLCGLDEKERVEKILGMEFATMFFNECSQIPYDSVVLALTRLAQVCEGLQQRAFFDLNPPDRGHWTNVLFIQKRDPVSKQPLENPDDYQHLFFPMLANRENLTAEYISSMEHLPARKKRRFFDGIYGDDSEGALWTYEMIEKSRRKPEQVPDLRAIVIAVDPSGAKDVEDVDHDAIGIIAVGLGVDGHGYILADQTCIDGPHGWGKRAVNLYHDRRADHVTGEINYGGAMVEFVIKSIDPQVPFRSVTASRGKVVRAEPVASLHEQGLIHIVGHMPELEDELCGFTTLGYIGEASPNRADALVWGVTDLMLADSGQAWVDHYAKLAAAANTPAVEQPKDVLPFANGHTNGHGGQRPTLNGGGNELTEMYRETLKQYEAAPTICANARCGKPVDGDTRVTDGVNVWHQGCY
jgi:hypothetical protein